MDAVKQKKSEALVACPPCGPVSILQWLRKYRGEEYEKALREGKELLNLQWNVRTSTYTRTQVRLRISVVGSVLAARKRSEDLGIRRGH